MILILILPVILFMGDRLLNQPAQHIKRIGNDRVWLTQANTGKAYKELVYREKLIESAIKIKGHVAETECVYSIYPEIIMLYGKRKSLNPGFDYINDSDFYENLSECKYIFVIGAYHKQHSPLYPIDRVKDLTWILDQTFYPEDIDNNIISILLEIDEIALNIKRTASY